MMLIFYKVKRELFRLLKPLLPADSFASKIRELQLQTLRLEAKKTLAYQAQSLFAPPKHCPSPKPIDILIPVYNGYDYLQPCLQSVMQNTDLPFHIYLADDCSPDKRVLPLLKEWAAKYPDKITLLINTQNSGFAKTVNKLIAASQNDVVLLNTDTEVPPAWASRLLYPIFTNEKVASSGPWTNSGSFQNFFFNHQDLPLDIPLEEMDRTVRDFSPDTLLAFPEIVGFCMAISRKVLQQIGPLDEIYGRGYYEETDWCFRANKAGFLHCLVPNLFLYHKGRSSFGSVACSELLKHNRKIFRKRYPLGERQIHTARKQPLFQILHFIVLARYLALKYPLFATEKQTSDIPQLTVQGPCYCMKWQDLILYAYQKEPLVPLLLKVRKQTPA